MEHVAYHVNPHTCMGCGADFDCGWPRCPYIKRLTHGTHMAILVKRLKRPN